MAAISTARLFYDGGRHSLLYGIKDFSTSPVTFKVRETFLNSMTPSVDYLLQPSVAVTNVSGRDYGNMSDLNITFTAEKLLYNYPVESHVYVMDRKSGEQKVFEADSRFTKNVAEKCEPVEDDRDLCFPRHEIPTYSCAPFFSLLHWYYNT